MTEDLKGIDENRFCFLDYRCPKCGRRWGWHGYLKDRPKTCLCPKCRPKMAAASGPPKSEK